jgi:hypothetical protein
MMAEEHLKQNQACKIMQVNDSQVLRWHSNRVSLEEAARPEGQSLHPGPAGCVDAFTEELVFFVDKWHGKGILVSCLCLIGKACKLSPAFSDKTLSAQKMSISCFMAKNGLVHCMAMHTAQRPPQEMYDEARWYLDVIVPITIINNWNRLSAFTVNMDQTLVLPTMTPKDTINRRGTHMINLHMASGNIRQVTNAITITASGHQLPSLVVFKGKTFLFCNANTVSDIMVHCCILAAGMPNGKIARREVPTLPAGIVYRLNKKAWFNKQILLYWVEHVLAPYVATTLPGIIPILLLYKFKVHKMGLIVNPIHALGMQVEFIPAGCTGLVQPVNVGYNNKSFKCKMHNKFLAWLMSQDPNVPIPGSTCHDVAQWIINVQNNISMETILNAWRKTGFSYYSKNPDNKMK